MDNDIVFTDFYQLEEAYIQGHITLNMYLNEYNRLTEIEADKMIQSTPREGRT